MVTWTQVLVVKCWHRSVVTRTQEYLFSLTTSQLGIHHKLVGILNVCGFYDHMLAQLRRGIEVGCPVAHPHIHTSTHPHRLVHTRTTGISLST